MAIVVYFRARRQYNQIPRESLHEYFEHTGVRIRKIGHVHNSRCMHGWDRWRDTSLIADHSQVLCICWRASLCEATVLLELELSLIDWRHFPRGVRCTGSLARPYTSSRPPIYLTQQFLTILQDTGSPTADSTRLLLGVAVFLQVVLFTRCDMGCGGCEMEAHLAAIWSITQNSTRWSWRWKCRYPTLQGTPP